MVPSWKDKRQEQCTGLLCEAAEPPSPYSVQPVAAGSHGPAAGAVSSFKLEAEYGTNAVEAAVNDLARYA